MPQSNKVVNVWLYLEEWSRCVSARFQRDALYRHGEFDSCSAQYDDLKLALRAKAMSDSEVAESLEVGSYYKRNLGSDPKNSPTAGFIWDLKKKPGWDVEDEEE